jgi:uncharacterized protein (DUF2235 family)
VACCGRDKPATAGLSECSKLHASIGENDARHGARPVSGRSPAEVVMAIYAFDGTWNSDKDGTDKDTNVCKFAQACPSSVSVLYQTGVGTRFGVAGRIIGGITGAGALDRINKAMSELERNYRKGERDIDIIGFSRGAAIAVEFAHRVFEKEIDGVKAPPIRFLGIWDCVPSFGIPGNSFNLGWHLNNVPDNVAKCFHALALDERRETFPLNRLSARVSDANQEGRLFEVWFRGVHSDIGGGNENIGLSDIALRWMFRSAERAGLPLDDVATSAACSHCDPATLISVHDFDPIPSPWRIVRWNDWVHESVGAREDEKPRFYNKVPAGLDVVDDDCKVQPTRFRDTAPGLSARAVGG